MGAAPPSEEIPLRPLSQPAQGALCTCGVISVLAVAWCVLDFWNRKVSDDLFRIGDIRMVDLAHSHDTVQVVAPFKKFTYPLSLAFLQFVFMSVVFLCMYWALTHQSPADLRGLRITSNRQWPALVVTHVFSTFWLQSLIMPSQVMSLGFFAASRSFEIPTAAILRTPVLGARFGKKTLQTTGLAFLAGCMLYFAYAQLAGCVCILSGNGVALTGAAFWVIYALILGMPATNAVYQEAIMLQSGIHPLLLLALQNIFAALLFGPVLILSHLVGWEDVAGAFATILSYQEIGLLVTWLCAQIALTSVIGIMLIQVVDSFWAIALRSLRVVFWALCTLVPFYMSSQGLPLSITNPRTSFWSFVIAFGVSLAAAAIYTDRKSEDDLQFEKDVADGTKI